MAKMATPYYQLMLNFQVCKIRGVKEREVGGISRCFKENHLVVVLVIAIGIFFYIIFLDYILLISIALYKSSC